MDRLLARLHERTFLDALHGFGPFQPDAALDATMLARGQKWCPFARKWKPLAARGDA